MEGNRKTYIITKRIIDIVGFLIGMIVLLPLFLLVALIIKLESPKEKVFFSQYRNGKDAKLFKMWKFRSMVTDAEKLFDELQKENEAKGFLFKMKEDPRVTRVGKFIRKTNIDELPQLFNVLKGDMSLVGPRPPLPREVAHYSNDQLKRLSVTPGLTGYWQVCRKDIWDFNQMVELDLKYIEQRTTWLDLKLIGKTILVIIIQNIKPTK